MLNEVIKEIILDFQSEKRDMGIARELDYTLLPSKAFICIGVRRSGKSTLLYQIIEDLVKKGVKRENILYLNFYDDRLSELRHGNLSIVLESYFSIYPEKKGTEKIYCFFDEIQEVKNWESFIDRAMRAENCEVFITGSSAKMLSKEIATQMRGRSLSWELFPFSFKEFLAGKGIEYKKPDSKSRLLLMKSFDEYCKTGGFPEVRNVTQALRVKVHQEYYKTILFRDIIERYDSPHPQAVTELSYRLLNSVSSLYSINRLTEYLKSLHYKTSKEFVSSCVSWFEDAYFIFSVRMYHRSVAVQNVNPKKCYAIDHAFAHSVTGSLQENKGALLENMVFVHLRRKSDKIYYYRTASGREVDFLWLDDKGKKHAVQVCLTLKDEKTRKRELNAVFQAMRELKEKDSVIVTLDEEEVIKVDGRTVSVLPAWKYLL